MDEQPRLKLDGPYSQCEPLDRFLYTRDPEDLAALLKFVAQHSIHRWASLPLEIRTVLIDLKQFTGNRDLDSKLALFRAIQMRERFAQTDDKQDLVSAVTLATIATNLVDQTDAQVLGNGILGLLLLESFKATNNLGNLFESVAVLHDAYLRAPDGSAIWQKVGTDFAMALKRFSDVQPDYISLDEASRIYESVMAIPPPESDVDASMHHNFGDLLALKFFRSGDQKDLDAAIIQRQLAVNSTSRNDRAFGLRIQGLADALVYRSLYRPSPIDLDAAIHTLTSALASAFASRRDHNKMSLALTSYKLLRYDSLKRVRDFENAVRIYSTVEVEANEDSRSACIKATIELLRWEHSRDQGLLEIAFRIFSEVLERDTACIAARFGVWAVGTVDPAAQQFIHATAIQMQAIESSGLLVQRLSDPLVAVLKSIVLRYS